MDGETKPLQFSLRSFLICCIFSSLALAVLIPAALGEGGVFVAPYRLLGDSALMALINPSALLAPVLAIAFIVFLFRNPNPPISLFVCGATVAIGVILLFAAGFSSGFYHTIQFLAPSSFLFALFGIAEVLIRRLNGHIPTAVCAFCLSLAYWTFMLGLASVVG